MSDFNKRYIDFCKPFIDAIKEVYSTMLSSEVTASDPQIKKDATSKGDYSAIMGINGVFKSDDGEKNFKGNLILSWPEETYIKSASAMLMEEYKEVTDEIADVGMEICNITMGNAKKVLCEKGYFIEMSTPTSVSGPKHKISVLEGVTTIVTPLKSSHGEFYIELNYEDY
ncbi:MAG: hypothetical protein GY909_02935 [Oligoflexia bacterium]|nr:hypothetical protein [Oligoflexia bacterium]